MQKAAIKKMNMQATKEFLAKLKVLTHVHQLNLVRLIGYYVEGSLCLVHEYVENGNLNQHLNSLVPYPIMVLHFQAEHCCHGLPLVQAALHAARVLTSIIFGFLYLQICPAESGTLQDAILI
uniref:Leucine-rich repeat receptor-like serine/threonine-protein kinase At2g14440 isoform X3 n=2 Tax=Nicotiana sylvestris TaxID=4096 RepID=A0A1U7XUK5_NICSY|nr:PREDICTED: putative leucine-rich repeat receptor-like serine/threonine-protein kinase At2g14440 isoform X3 [Nicotiana sylvestris]